MFRRPLAAIVTGALVATLMVAGTSAAQAATIDAPEAHVAVVDGDGDVSLSWDPTPGATAYRVEVATTPTFDAGTIVASADTYALTWIPTSVLAAVEARTLYWHVAAYTSGTSSTSRGSYSVAQTLDTEAMSVPVLVGPGSPDGGTVTYPTPVSFVWEPVPGAVSYDVQYSPDSAFPIESVRPIKNTTATSVTLDAPLEREAGGETIVWNWRVRANVYSGGVNAITGRWSQPSTFTVQWPAAASRPSLLTPAPWGAGNTAAISDVVFSWSPVPGAASYKVVVGVAKNDAGTVVTSEIAGAGGVTSATTLVPEVALLDQNYYWQVVAYDTAGRAGVPSAIREFRKQWGGQTSPTVTVGAATTYPVPNEGGTDFATAPEVDLDHFHLSWTPVPRATMYEVEVVPLNADPRLTCRTASTSASVIELVEAGSGLPSALEGANSCLWTATPTKRIQAGATYRWRVRAVDFSGSSTTPLKTAPPVGTLVSDWSDPEDAGLPERARYIKVVARPDTTAVVSEPDAAAFAGATTPELEGQPSPVFSWSPTNGATGYEVRFASNSAMTTQIAVVRTQGTTLRVNGVFDDNTTALPYYWQVRPFVHVGNEIAYIADGSAAHPSWVKKSRATDFVGVSPVTVSADGTTVLSWRPQGASAPLDGGSRGYLVSILNADGSLLGAEKVEYPSYVAQNPSTGKPLIKGTYKFTVAPLDANGNPGSASPAQDFEIALPKPVTDTVSLGSSSAVLRWTTTAAAARYEVWYWNTATAGSPTKVVGASVNKQTALTAADLVPGPYWWRVRWLDSGTGISDWSDDATFTVAGRTPELVTNDATTLPTSSRVLDWQPVAGASRYIVQWADSAGGVRDAVGYETAATSFALPSAVSFGKTYSWQVRAVSEKYVSSTGSSRVVLGTSGVRTFGALTTPGAPTAKTPTISGRDLTVTWTPLVGAAAGTEAALNYVVRYRAKVTPELPWTELEPTSANAASMVLVGLEANTTYEVAVSALSPEGQGPWSATVTKATATVPGAPTTLVLTPGPGTLKVTWRLPSSTGGAPLTGVTLRYQRETDDAWQTVPLLSTTTSYTITNLAANKPYRVEVDATNAIGTGPVAAAQATVASLPGVPTGIKYVRGDAFITVSWVAPVNTGGTPITGYTVEMRAYDRKTATWSAWAPKANVTATTLSYKATGLVNGSIYGLRVKAKTKYGTGLPSAVAQATPAKPPSAVPSVKATSTTGKITIAWGTPALNGSTLTGFVVQYSTDKKVWGSMPLTATTKRSLAWTKGSVGKTYYFRVIAKSSLGNSPYSTVVAAVRR